jgi:hypothetical protein
MDLLNEEYIDNLITNLKVIGLIEINDKLVIRKGHLQIDHESNIRSLIRWFNRDSRDSILKFIKEVFRNIYHVINKIKSKEITDESSWIFTRIISEFEKVEMGLNNLKITYSPDPVVIVTIDNIITKMKEIYEQIKSQL